MGQRAPNEVQLLNAHFDKESQQVVWRVVDDLNQHWLYKGREVRFGKIEQRIHNGVDTYVTAVRDIHGMNLTFERVTAT